MKVYIRHIDDTKAVYLTEVQDFNDTAKMVPFLKQVGVYVGGSTFGEDDSFETQVVVDGEDAYLEVIVG